MSYKKEEITAESVIEDIQKYFKIGKYNKEKGNEDGKLFSKTMDGYTDNMYTVINMENNRYNNLCNKTYRYNNKIINKFLE